MGIPGTGNEDHAHKGSNFRQLVGPVGLCCSTEVQFPSRHRGCDVGRSLVKSTPLANARPDPITLSRATGFPLAAILRPCEPWLGPRRFKDVTSGAPARSR